MSMNIKSTKLELVGDYDVSVEYLEGNTAEVRIFRMDGGAVEFLHTDTEGVVTPLQVGGYRGSFTFKTSSFSELARRAREARRAQLYKPKEESESTV